MNFEYSLDLKIGSMSLTRTIVCYEVFTAVSSEAYD